MGYFSGRFKARGSRAKAPAQRLADELLKAGQPFPVTAVANNVHAAPTQHRILPSRVVRLSETMAVAETISQCSQLVPPGMVDSPTPLEIPVTGHNVVLSFFNRSAVDMRVTRLRAVFLWMAQCEFPAQLKSRPPSNIPPLILAEDLRSSVEEAGKGYMPLEIPHFEVHLDGARPLIVDALLPGSKRSRVDVSLPLLLGPGKSARLVLAPVASGHYCVAWRLLADWSEGDAPLLAAWDLTTTGFTGWSIFSGNSAPQPCPVAELGHWDPHSYYADGDQTYEDELAVTLESNPAWLKVAQAGSDEEADPSS